MTFPVTHASRSADTFPRDLCKRCSANHPRLVCRVPPNIVPEPRQAAPAFERAAGSKCQRQTFCSSCRYPSTVRASYPLKPNRMSASLDPNSSIRLSRQAHAFPPVTGIPPYDAHSSVIRVHATAPRRRTSPASRARPYPGCRTRASARGRSLSRGRWPAGRAARNTVRPRLDASAQRDNGSHNAMPVAGYSPLTARRTIRSSPSRSMSISLPRLRVISGSATRAST